MNKHYIFVETAYIRSSKYHNTLITSFFFFSSVGFFFSFSVLACLVTMWKYVICMHKHHVYEKFKFNRTGNLFAFIFRLNLTKSSHSQTEIVQNKNQTTWSGNATEKTNDFIFQMFHLKIWQQQQSTNTWTIANFDILKFLETFAKHQKNLDYLLICWNASKRRKKSFYFLFSFRNGM